MDIIYSELPKNKLFKISNQSNFFLMSEYYYYKFLFKLTKFIMYVFGTNRKIQNEYKAFVKEERDKALEYESIVAERKIRENKNIMI